VSHRQVLEPQLTETGSEFPQGCHFWVGPRLFAERIVIERGLSGWQTWPRNSLASEPLDEALNTEVAPVVDAVLAINLVDEAILQRRPRGAKGPEHGGVYGDPEMFHDRDGLHELPAIPSSSPTLRALFPAGDHGREEPAKGVNIRGAVVEDGRAFRLRPWATT
jgi:hypothetical protein